MKIYCTNTARGLVPNYDSDFEEKKKLKIGATYKCEITLARNYEFHKKYFALINCAWEYQDERRQVFFKDDIERFRKSVEIAAGHCDIIYLLDRKEWVESPKSIAFEKMDEAAFSDLYEKVKRVLFAVFLRHITEEEFMKNLVNF